MKMLSDSAFDAQKMSNLDLSLFKHTFYEKSHYLRNLYIIMHPHYMGLWEKLGYGDSGEPTRNDISVFKLI